MKTSGLMCALFLSGFLQAQSDALPAPHFHHLHLNSVNPDAPIDFYTQQLRREGVIFLKEPYMLGTCAQ